jgi:hypothetical protein
VANLGLHLAGVGGGRRPKPNTSPGVRFCLLRCTVFAVRKDGAAEKRYQQLVKILRGSVRAAPSVCTISDSILCGHGSQGLQPMRRSFDTQRR